MKLIKTEYGYCYEKRPDDIKPFSLGCRNCCRLPNGKIITCCYYCIWHERGHYPKDQIAAKKDFRNQQKMKR